MTLRWSRTIPMRRLYKLLNNGLVFLQMMFCINILGLSLADFNRKACALGGSLRERRFG
jgi:hypothetical protein